MTSALKNTFIKKFTFTFGTWRFESFGEDRQDKTQSSSLPKSEYTPSAKQSHTRKTQNIYPGLKKYSVAINEELSSILINNISSSEHDNVVERTIFNIHNQRELEFNKDDMNVLGSSKYDPSHNNPYKTM